MCNRYVSPADYEMEYTWHLRKSQVWPGGGVYPRAKGPFIRGMMDGNAPSYELVVGQWGLIPWFSKTPKITFATNNARFEELTAKASYKEAWARGQRCIIPAVSFDEPCWESGKNVWWQFWRADGKLWGLAGLWNRWVDKSTGEIHESYTMLTQNADAHPLMSRMHKPDPKLPADRQDKRSIVAIENEYVMTWLFGTPEEAAKLLQLSPPELFRAVPAEEAPPRKGSIRTKHVASKA